MNGTGHGRLIEQTRLGFVVFVEDKWDMQTRTRNWIIHLFIHFISFKQQ